MQSIRIFALRSRHCLMSGKCTFAWESRVPAVHLAGNVPCFYRTSRSMQSFLQKTVFPRYFSAQANVRPVDENQNQSALEGQDDRLYRMIELELKGHEEAVLNSYEWFLLRAAEELGVNVSRVYTPLRHYNRFSLHKSAFIYKKHMVQYEFRTYFRAVQLKHLTGSTADTYLEYVQRNLPEGVAMKVITCAIEELPESIGSSQNEEVNPIKNEPNSN